VLGDAGTDDRSLTNTWCVHPEIAQAGTGDTVVLWGGAELHAGRRRGGATAWEQPTIVSDGPSCFALDVATDPEGDAVAIWNAGTGATPRLDAAVLDATPPIVSKVAIPRAAHTGAEVRMAIAASDTWSPLVAPLWRLGDRTRVRGMRVKHVFQQPGRYRIRVTVADHAGNTAIATGTIRVRKKSS
jgi:hypothetical protein